MEIKKFQNKVLSWYKKNKRDLPWRKTTDPYKILVSEVMLQQTQVERVIPYYQNWLKQFPDFKTLAKADKKTLLNYWQGLGYNNRALRLQKTAQTLVHQKRKTLLPDPIFLMSLPGIGEYTANAVLAFAFNEPAPVMDTNIRRVLIHELKLPEDTSLEKLKVIAKKCIPKGKSCIWHNALMDYGAIKKTARVTGIKSLSKQGPFLGSDRWLRGQILKRVLEVNSKSISSLKKELDHPRFDEVLKKMIAEEIVKKSSRSIKIA